MASKSKGGYYAVAYGRQTGVFLDWNTCEAQVKGFQGAKYKKFSNHEDAEAFVNPGSDPAAPSVSTNSVPASQATSSFEASSSVAAAPSTVSADAHYVDESGATWDVVYSDGACKGNGKENSVAGIGVWWGPNDPRNIAERCPGDQTNNRAELIAIVRVLETAQGSQRLMIKTDSQYSINCFDSWLPKWQRNGYLAADGKPVKNVGIIRYIASLLNLRIEQGQRVRLVYVKGHAGIAGNEGADAQANKGALMHPRPERDWTSLEKATLQKLEGVREKKKREGQTKPVAVEVEVATELPPSMTSPKKPRMSQTKKVLLSISQEEAEFLAEALLNDDELWREIERD